MSLKHVAAGIFVILFPLSFGAASCGRSGPGRAAVQPATCRATSAGSSMELESPSFRYRLDLSGGLKAVSWENRLTGRTLPLGSRDDFEVDVDASDRRVFITGWKAVFSHPGPCTPDEEPGFKNHFASPDFDDETWPGRATIPPSSARESPVYADYYWARTHVFLPLEAESRDLSLILGGFGLFDFRYLRVFVNGHEVGSRLAEKRWSEPGVFDLGLKSTVHSHLRFGNDNIIAVQACGYRCRTAQLDDVDPHRDRSLPPRYYWPGQFEQTIVVGRPLLTPRLRVADVRVAEETGQCRVRCDLTADGSEITARVVYQWNAAEPVLHKFVEIRNAGRTAVRLVNVRLGTYATGQAVTEGEQGFPVYIDGQFFASLAHPAGWALGQEGEVRLRQYPGRRLAPGETFSCMESVLGVAHEGQARPVFISHVRSRMRRVRRGHDKSYAIFDSFGSWPSGDWWGETEDFVLKQIRQTIAPEMKESGCDYDFYVVELWRDVKGDLERPNPANFPHGFSPIIAELRRQKLQFALWITTGLGSWTIGKNPVIAPAIVHDPAYGSDEGLDWLCLATDPLKTMLATAFLNQVRNNGLRLVKFDGTSSICYNPRHDHLPGVYSTEAIDDSFIRIMDQLDRACPDLFIMLYWGPRSPWWLLHGDTLFESGLAIEAAHPCSTPTPYIRDSVTLGLDQAQRFAADVPALGKDSLGTWLSEWGWNSGIGKEHWQEGFVMDMGRGSLLAQPWSDNGSLTALERGQMGDFIHLLKGRTDCFANTRPILGDPWKNEPYGYCCSNGERAFLTLNNCTWDDKTLMLELNSKWGLPDGRAWDIYRWYPRSARLTKSGRADKKAASVPLRPFEVVLLEIVPEGAKPSLDRQFESRPVESTLGEPSRRLEIETIPGPASQALPVPREKGLSPEARAGLPPKRVLRINCQVPPSKTGGMLVVSAQLRRDDRDFSLGGSGAYFSITARLTNAGIPAEAIIPGQSFPAPWQGWRVRLGPSDKPQTLEAVVTAMVPIDVTVSCSAYFIPR